jgi:hypothetical protein
MLGDLPPSSSETRFIVRAAVSYTLIPVTSEPVKVTLATSGCSTRALPTSGPKPVTTLKTPAGRPACSARAANSSVLTEANSDGFTTTVHPAARAGAHLTAVNHSGEFQAVRAATTPIGSRSVKATMSGFSMGIEAPSILSASPA